MACPVVTFCNHKGGVAKTTMTIACAQIMVKEFGLGKVLVIDCDSQGNASEALSPADVTELHTLDECLENPSGAPESVYPSWFDGIFILPSNTKLEAPVPGSIDDCDITSVPIAYRTKKEAVKEIIDLVSSEYDMILVDTAPTLAPLTQSAIFAASHIVIPCSPTKHAVFGMPVMYKAAKDLNPGAKIMVAITIHDNRTPYENVTAINLEKQFSVVADVQRNSRLVENIAKHAYVLSRMDRDRSVTLMQFCRVLAISTGIDGHLDGAGSEGGREK